MSELVEEECTLKVINSKNVGSLTTFEIRQELDRRQCMDIPDKEINHRSLLQRLVKELVMEEEINYNNEIANKEKQRLEELEKAKAEREKKKAEALERSRRRQQDPNYFANKAANNDQLKEKEQEKINNRSISNKKDENGDENEIVEDDDEEEEEEDDDPFRITSKTKRNKMHW